MSFLKIAASLLLLTISRIESSVVGPAISYAHVAPPSTVPFAASVSTFTRGLPYFAAPYAAGVHPGPAFVPAPAPFAPATYAAAAPFAPATYAAGAPLVPGPYFAGAPAVAAAAPVVPGPPAFLPGPIGRSVHAVAPGYPGFAPAFPGPALGRLF